MHISDGQAWFYRVLAYAICERRAHYCYVGLFLKIH